MVPPTLVTGVGERSRLESPQSLHSRQPDTALLPVVLGSIHRRLGAGRLVSEYSPSGDVHPLLIVLLSLGSLSKEETRIREDGTSVSGLLPLDPSLIMSFSTDGRILPEYQKVRDLKWRKKGKVGDPPLHSRHGNP